MSWQNFSHLTLFALATLTACTVRSEGDEPPGAGPSACEPMMFEDTPFTVCTAVPGEHRIGTDLAPPTDDVPFVSLTDYAGFRGEDADSISFVMNAGMFDPDLQPVGYYVEDGRRLNLLNEREEGPGNFHMVPNGVFYGDATGGWQVRETGDFGENVADRPMFATQSGPMLVVRGRLHPDFAHDGASRKTRNAVGVDASGRAIFVLSEAPVSFGKLARFYRDVLKVENALFLDGGVSQLWDRPAGRMDRGAELGPLIVVENRATAAP